MLLSRAAGPRVFGAVVTTTLLTLTGCQLQTIQPTLAPDHPANPATASAPPREVGAVFDLKPGQAIPASTATGHASSEMVYVCPMHPEVRQAEPAKCPICHMTLKPEYVSHGEKHP